MRSSMLPLAVTAITAQKSEHARQCEIPVRCIGYRIEDDGYVLTAGGLLPDRQDFQVVEIAEDCLA